MYSSASTERKALRVQPVPYHLQTWIYFARSTMVLLKICIAGCGSLKNSSIAKYEDKRWIPRNSTARSHLQYGEEKVSEYKEKSDDRRAQGSINKADSPGEHKSPEQQGPKKTSLVVPKLPTPEQKFLVGVILMVPCYAIESKVKMLGAEELSIGDLEI
ncbi:uncharacterized protein A4U43_C07F22960 [Asparagus officinalis]|uniref:Uncharacterized protein n=1 Tax=Asparagus officinalis TaxID=4686 RepID=A0A5P1EE99_ASPOF|nr:uncharacterized protein A4U43_C07F22960 [Asparagus officinalis]